MRAHLVYAHPEPKSFCAAMKDTAVTALAEAGHVVTISDLYAERCNPVASGADFVMRRDPRYLSYALEQRRAIEWDTLAPDITREVERVLAADLLFLVFPVFWFSMPAILMPPTTALISSRKSERKRSGSRDSLATRAISPVIRI